MSSRIGKSAAIVGAGIGGLTAARVLADHFDRVLVLERDALPEHAADRVGVPQGKHVHALLAGGQRALGELFPGFEHDLAQSGAVALRIALDIRTERPDYDPFPQRDLGWHVYAMSRAQIESRVRERVRAVGNVEIRQRCRVEQFVARSDGTVTGVLYRTPDGRSDTLPAELVVDASGRGTLTLALLESIGWPRPEETRIGVDVAYATAIFAIPDGKPPDWTGVFCFPQPPRSRGGLLLPIEGGRWILTVGSRHGDDPPSTEEGFIAFAQSLRTPTIGNAIRHAKRLGEIARFRFPESVYRHYERLDALPRGLLPLGDAVCRFNPVYGQGMSVAAQEARALGRLLVTRATASEPLDGLATQFFAEATVLIETPWASAAIPDFVHPKTRGERPENFEQSLRFGLALEKLAARDPAVHTLVAEVQHLLKPRRVHRDPDLVERVLAVMAEG